ncbi:DUF1223 domain-containing protein [Pararhodobacter zhoushanensis]|uniref:DUF1223 domain-containing protein n=1 Tax=Pararhodobacter zhoushanensis TaxID=2479545 RepID=A0ABT3H354_9RHOB|nr:DUF1223 domain-containing protein [Pararhodobacter zhoushanensis]MCW1934222.1 DUF1223 domain-containing protein [Pararhodobacter zhoushanensis]
MTLIAWMRTGIGSRTRNGSMRAGLVGARRVCGTAALAVVLASGAVAQDTPSTTVDHPVLLELYTAQGCASCPPADEMMLELAGRDDVVALSLHVDYWDYIGWADTFAQRAYTERQQRYARRYGHSTIYTPQVVINGTQIMEGYLVMQVMDAITAQRDDQAEVALTLARTEDGALQITATPTSAAAPQIAMASRRAAITGMQTNTVVGTLSMGGSAQAGSEAAGAVPAPRPAVGPYTVQLVRYHPMETVDIRGGENAGRVAQYANIVTSWEPVSSWDMLSPLSLTVPLEGDDPAVVIIQESGQGAVMATARIR